MMMMIMMMTIMTTITFIIEASIPADSKREHNKVLASIAIISKVKTKRVLRQIK